MAYERYSDKNGRLYIVLARWHKSTIVAGEPLFYPTTVDVLYVNQEEVKSVQHIVFEERIESGVLKRVTK